VLAICCATGANAAEGSDKVLATIGNETVTEKDLEQMAEAVPERFRNLYLTPAGRRQTLDYIVNVYALASAAKQAGLAESPSFQRLITFARKDLLARMYLEEQGKDIPAPTEAEAKRYYEENIDQFQRPEMVHLRHILVKSEKEAQDMLTKLKKGAKFEELASKHSICPSKERGGDLDWLPRGKLVAEIDEVAFDMKEGEIRGPIQSRFGYHVVLLEGKRAAGKSSFAEVKPYIMEQLKYKKQQEHYQQLAEEWRKKLNVKISMPEAPKAQAPTAPPVSQ
jgi:peptidyl-prolyl cis-trans isomerase C